MIRKLFAAALLSFIATQVHAEQVWLVVGASDDSPAGIAEKAKALAPLSDKGLVVQMSDCGQKKNIFAWTAIVSTSSSEAKVALANLHKSVKDAYLKRCVVVPHSLLDFRFTAVDPSIADVPHDAVNWEDEHRISTIKPLPEGGAIVIVRNYVDEKEDPLEGRREQVVLISKSVKKQVLEANCFNPSGIVEKDGKVAFSCEREQAGEHILHSVVSYNIDGEKLADIEYCRAPRWVDAQTLECDNEVVGPDGALKLQPRKVEVNRQ
jgi:hypothetical protein